MYLFIIARLIYNTEKLPVYYQANALNNKPEIPDCW